MFTQYILWLFFYRCDVAPVHQSAAGGRLYFGTHDVTGTHDVPIHSSATCKPSKARKQHIEQTTISQEDCLSFAAAQYGNKVFAAKNTLQLSSSEETSGPPRGCSVHAGGDWAVYYNSNVHQTSGSADFKTVGRNPEAADQCGILESEVDAKCGAWDLCAGVICHANLKIGGAPACLARQKITHRTHDEYHSYVKTDVKGLLANSDWYRELQPTYNGILKGGAGYIKLGNWHIGDVDGDNFAFSNVGTKRSAVVFQSDGKMYSGNDKSPWRWCADADSVISSDSYCKCGGQVRYGATVSE